MYVTNIQQASSTAFSALNASFGALTATTSLAALGPASFANSANFFGLTSFGATATTTISTTGTISSPSIIATNAAASTASFGATGTSTFTSSGFLGIGTTTPGSALSIQGNIFLAGNLVSTSTVASIFPYASSTALTISGTASTTNLIVSGAGGTAGCAQFSVTGLISNTGSACGSGSAAFPFTPTLNFGANTNATSTALSLFGGLNASSTIRFGNAGVSGFLFDSTTGNLGIGTSTPGTLLSLGNTGANTINISATATSTFGSGINIATGCFSILGTCLSTSGGGSSFDYLFPSNATSTALTFSGGLLSLASTTVGNGNQNGGLTINGGATTTGNAYFGGNVGIGTPVPSSRLHVYGNVASPVTLMIENAFNNANSRTRLEFRNYTVEPAYIDSGYSDYGMNIVAGRNNLGTIALKTLTGGTEQTRLFVSNNGNVGIGTTTPWRKLSVTGTVGFDGLTANFGAGSLCLTANKEVVYNDASDSCTSSLRATKHDISPLAVDALSQVLALQPVSWH